MCSRIKLLPTRAVDSYLILPLAHSRSALPRLSLSAAIRHAKRRPRIIPTADTFVRAHYPAGAAFKTARVFEADLVALQPVEHRRANYQARLVAALGAEGLVDDDVWMPLINIELVQ